MASFTMEDLLKHGPCSEGIVYLKQRGKIQLKTALDYNDFVSSGSVDVFLSKVWTARVVNLRVPSILDVDPIALYRYLKLELFKDPSKLADFEKLFDEVAVL